MKKPKFYWHIHHNILMELLLEPIENRIKYIIENKPKEEIELRLRLLKPVKGKLPTMFIAAREACDKAREAYDKAREAETYNEARKAYEKAGEASDEARKACREEIEVLHKLECPDCPWNGKSIF